MNFEHYSIDQEIGFLERMLEDARMDVACTQKIFWMAQKRENDLSNRLVQLNNTLAFTEGNMDKKISKIQKETKEVGKDLKELKKEDKKRDPACEAGMKMMKAKNKHK